MLLIGKKSNALNPSGEAIQVLKHHEQTLGDECLKHIKKVVGATARLNKNWESKILEEVSFIVHLNKGRQALRNTISEFKQAEISKNKGATGLRFQVSSLFLADCWHFLTKDALQHERLHLVTGTETEDGIKVLSRIEHVKLQKQSSAYVKADDADAHLKIVTLSEKHGHLLLAVFHSHIAKGPNSTHPSGTDVAFQDRLAKLGCPAIGGIFSLDGYVRFFSTWKPFEIEVYGKGVEKLNDEPKQKVFQIHDAEKRGF